MGWSGGREEGRRTGGLKAYPAHHTSVEGMVYKANRLCACWILYTTSGAKVFNLLKTVANFRHVPGLLGLEAHERYLHGRRRRRRRTKKKRTKTSWAKWWWRRRRRVGLKTCATTCDWVEEARNDVRGGRTSIKDL